MCGGKHCPADYPRWHILNDCVYQSLAFTARLSRFGFGHMFALQCGFLFLPFAVCLFNVIMFLMSFLLFSCPVHLLTYNDVFCFVLFPICKRRCLMPQCWCNAGSSRPIMQAWCCSIQCICNIFVNLDPVAQFTSQHTSMPASSSQALFSNKASIRRAYDSSYYYTT